MRLRHSLALSAAIVIGLALWRLKRLGLEPQKRNPQVAGQAASECDWRDAAVSGIELLTQ